MKHYAEYEAVDFTKAFHYFRYGYYDCFYLRLPSWDFREDWQRRRYGWHQLHLCWHGRDGFSLRWIPKEFRK